jgi:hypothetical protein
MKREFPYLHSIVSRFISVPIVSITTVFYVINAINNKSSEFYAIAITAFGITATLSGVCFTMDSSINREKRIRYSGEKFLHASVLLIQMIVIFFAKDSLLNLNFIIEHKWIHRFIECFFLFVMVFVSGMAGLFWLWGLDSINEELWQRYKHRLKKLNENDKSNEGETKQVSESISKNNS